MYDYFPCMIEILCIVILYIKRPLLSMRIHSNFLSISNSLQQKVNFMSQKRLFL
ncbi:hypothetical protein RchiOBHm_Chr5g0028681 [Rosa chinensis]|uniref:Uncharacterized protein n=1 Tax=Rosa chinensis TaxID=74649 RepID=A0A2P6Q9F8_ROSCH|nr:hypothetical protein RchiOBHm_Chr5g0028681 [Rosa chinensis]